MSHKILNTREDITKTTTVEFTFANGSKKILDVPHFNPKDDADIELGLSNREISEQRAIDELKEMTEEDIKVEPLKEVNL